MSQTKPTILLVDDDRALTDLLGLTLRECGFEVTAAHHAIQALTLQHENPRDLLILDINMPGGNGLAVCELLGGDRRTATMPVIIFTGSSDQSTRLRCQTLGARYIHKGDAAVSRVCELARQLLSPETQIHSHTTSLYFG
jgi:DNA-binding response OmpR family regulator